MNWDIILAILGGLGGLEFIKWIVNRKSNSRIAEAEATEKEFGVLEKSMMFLQTQLSNKEESFADQTQIVRKQNQEILALERRVAELEIELVQVRCNDEDCPWRKPPTAKTPPKTSLTKEEYHLKKELETTKKQA